VTDDIAAFIRARLDERANADWHARTCQTHQAMPPGTPFGLGGSPMSCNCGVPNLLEADVEAKRRIVDKVVGWGHQRLYDKLGENTGPYSCSRDGATCECGVLEQQLDVLHPFASEHSTHPDYRPDWSL
jgi:hypothetical protein